MKWNYHRIKSAKCSKWVCGNCWVTKYDNQPLCVMGVNGKRITNEYITAPKEARGVVEKYASSEIAFG